MFKKKIHTTFDKINNQFVVCLLNIMQLRESFGQFWPPKKEKRS